MIRDFLVAGSIMVFTLMMSVSSQAFAKNATASYSHDVVGREVAAPPWSAACMTDHGPSRCDEPMWVYDSPAAVSRYKSAFDTGQLSTSTRKTQRDFRCHSAVGLKPSMLHGPDAPGYMSRCASASAATVKHSRTHHYVVALHSQGVTSRFTVLSTVNAAPRPAIHGEDKEGSFGADPSTGNRTVYYETSRKYWSGYSLYAYDPDCVDFFFRHPDYPWLPSCN